MDQNVLCYHAQGIQFQALNPYLLLEKKQEKVSAVSMEIDQDSIQEFYKKQLETKSCNGDFLNNEYDDMCDNEYCSDFFDDEIIDDVSESSDCYSTEDDVADEFSLNLF